jgi:LAO/AO transport system kinase
MKNFGQLIADVRAGGPSSVRAAAKLMTALTDEPHRLAELLAGADKWPQPRLVLGVTGCPGSGKSTLVDHLAAEFRARDPERRVGIIAVDPSSPFTGGAVLGDRVRMMRHATDPGVFIRSLATRGRLGGLALGVRGIVMVMGLAGCEIVMIETVGVGQSEVEIARNSDLVTIVLAPGQGDSVQLLKAGLMEAGDIFVVNKADRDGAEQLRQQLLSMLALHQRVRVGLIGPTLAVSPTVFSASAVSHAGVPEIASAMEQWAVSHAADWRARRKQQAINEVRASVHEAVDRRVNRALGANGAAEDRLEQVLRGDLSIDELVERLLQDAAGARFRHVTVSAPTPME